MIKNTSQWISEIILLSFQAFLSLAYSVLTRVCILNKLIKTEIFRSFVLSNFSSNELCNPILDPGLFWYARQVFFKHNWEEATYIPIFQIEQARCHKHREKEHIWILNWLFGNIFCYLISNITKARKDSC